MSHWSDGISRSSRVASTWRKASAIRRAGAAPGVLRLRDAAGPRHRIVKVGHQPVRTGAAPGRLLAREAYRGTFCRGMVVGSSVPCLTSCAT